MIKYIATQLPAESFSPESYYNDELAKQDNIWIGGNTELRELNEDLRITYIQGLKKLYEDLEEARIDDKELDLEEVIKDDIKNDSEYSKQDLNYLYDLAYEYGSSKGEERLETVCKLLAFYFKEEFSFDKISGSFQGEWNYMIYPISKKDKIAWIESIYFGEGSEFEITQVGEDDFYSYEYFYESDIGVIREKIASLYNCKENEIEIKLISDVRVTYNYTYETK